MSSYDITPEAYEQQQRDAYNALNIESQRRSLLSERDKLSKEIDNRLGIGNGISTTMLVVATIVVFFVGCGLGAVSPALSYTVFVAIVLFWVVRIMRGININNRHSEVVSKLKGLDSHQSQEWAAMEERIRKYQEEYIAHHSQKLAIGMASSAAVKAIAGQLSLLYKKEIDECDRNGYIKTIEIIMELDVNPYNVNYVFWQRGTVSPKPRKSASFTFKEFGAQDLNRPEERNGAARAISSMIQTSLLEKYISNDSTPTVTVENKKTEEYCYGGTNRTIIHEDGFVITFSQINSNFEGERGWM